MSYLSKKTEDAGSGQGSMIFPSDLFNQRAIRNGHPQTIVPIGPPLSSSQAAGVGFGTGAIGALSGVDCQ